MSTIASLARYELRLCDRKIFNIVSKRNGARATRECVYSVYTVYTALIYFERCEACARVCVRLQRAREKNAKFRTKRPCDCFLPAFDIMYTCGTIYGRIYELRPSTLVSPHYAIVYSAGGMCGVYRYFHSSAMYGDRVRAKSCAKYFINENLCQHQHTCIYTRGRKRESFSKYVLCAAAVDPLKNSPQTLSDHI